MCTSHLSSVAPSPCLTAVLKSALPSGLPLRIASHVLLSSPLRCQALHWEKAASSVFGELSRKPEKISFKRNGVSVRTMQVHDAPQDGQSTGRASFRTTASPGANGSQYEQVVCNAVSSKSEDDRQARKSYSKESKGWGGGPKIEGDSGSGKKNGRQQFDYNTSRSFQRKTKNRPENEVANVKSFSKQTRESSTALGPASRNDSVQGEAAQNPREDRRPRHGDGWVEKRRDASNELGSEIFEDKKKKKKPPKIKDQVLFLSPLRKNPHVAILGGGMSGLICALTLQERGIRSTVFDTGKHGLGGRMGTRHIAQHNDCQLVFDHAAQYFTVTDPKFRKLVDRWIAEGAVKEWDGVVGRLQKEGNFVELPHGTKYVASHGMRLLAEHIVSERKLINIKRPCWISRMDAANGQWYLTENGKPQGEFDIVVIAHNGKCANRLLAPVGVPLVAKQMKRLELSSIWALLAAFEEPLPLLKGKVQLDGAFVDGVDSISWIANNTKKLQPSQSQGPHCWTFFSTAAYGKKNKVPQESIPTVRAAKVTREMLRGVESAFGLAEGSLPAPFYTKVQLWGAALPINTPNVPCIFDAYGRVGICGDWLLGSNLEAAALSGMAMANHISTYCNSEGSNPEDFSIGLDKLFAKIDGHDIGQFASQESVHQLLTPELLTTS